jgi:hypothetical protein
VSPENPVAGGAAKPIKGSTEKQQLLPAPRIFSVGHTVVEKIDTTSSVK